MSDRGMKAAVRELNLVEAAAIVERGRVAPLAAEEWDKLEATVQTLSLLTEKINQKSASIARLRQLIFGAKTEKTKEVLGAADAASAEARADTSINGAATPADTGIDSAATPADAGKRADKGGEEKKREGHGRNGAGLPFNRLEKPRQSMGIPLPAATQWDLVHAGARDLLSAWHELTREAAQGEVLHNDDTRMKVLELTAEARAQTAADEGTDGDRTGSFTSGIVSRREDRQIALFITGIQHAGENLEDVIKQRAAALSPPIQMCDALDANTAGDFETIVAHCLAHARRKYVDVAESFPLECRFVLETPRDVYRNDARARSRQLAPADRLRFHQTESGPALKKLEDWMRQCLDEKKVEPNSGLGEAIRYMRKHWHELTLFPQVVGAPLDNNACERTHKRAILHRENSLFYKTLNGALVGDIFMSLIHTAELYDVSSFDYLVTLLRHRDALRATPADWMPWSYTATLARLQPSPSA